MNENLKIAKNNFLLAREKLNSASKLYGDKDTARDFGMIMGILVELAVKGIIAASGHGYQKNHRIENLLIKAQDVSSLDLNKFKILLKTESFIVNSRYEYDGDWELKEPDLILEKATELIELGESFLKSKITLK